MAIDPVVERLCRRSPSFTLIDAPELADLGPYALLGELAHHLVGQMEVGDTADAAAVLDEVEQVLAAGDHHEGTVVRNGVLETLQNIASHRDVGVGGEAFLPLLGPLGTKEWHELNETWLLAAAARPEGGAVSVDDYLRVQDPDIRRHLQASRRELTDGRMIGISDVFAFEETRAAGVRAVARRMRRVTTWIVLAVLAVLVVMVLLG